MSIILTIHKTIPRLALTDRWWAWRRWALVF